MFSCTTYKNIGYLQNIEQLSIETLKLKAGAPELILKPGDMMTIVVSTTDPLASRAFNLIMPTYSGFGEKQLIGQDMIQTYLIDVKGEIVFPVIGTLQLAGLQKSEAEALIRSKLYPSYITEEPIITIRYTNFRVAILGEVAHPGSILIPNEQITLFEALAQVGDLSIFAKREDLLLVRTYADGSRETVRLDLRDGALIDSPFYYLQQNDLVYVEPNKSKGNSSSINSSETIWLSIVGSLLSVASLLVNILR